MYLKHTIFLQNGLLQNIESFQVFFILGATAISICISIFMIILVTHHKVVLLMSGLARFCRIQDFLGLAENGPSQVMMVFLPDISKFNRLFHAMILTSFSFQRSAFNMRPKFIKHAFWKPKNSLERLTPLFTLWLRIDILLRSGRVSLGFLEEDALQCVHATNNADQQNNQLCQIFESLLQSQHALYRLMLLPQLDFICSVIQFAKRFAFIKHMILVFTFWACWFINNFFLSEKLGSQQGIIANIFQAKLNSVSYQLTSIQIVQINKTVSPLASPFFYLNSLKKNSIQQSQLVINTMLSVRLCSIPATSETVFTGFKSLKLSCCTAIQLARFLQSLACVFFLNDSLKSCLNLVNTFFAVLQLILTYLAAQINFQFTSFMLKLSAVIKEINFCFCYCETLRVIRSFSQTCSDQVLRLDKLLLLGNLIVFWLIMARRGCWYIVDAQSTWKYYDGRMMQLKQICIIMMSQIIIDLQIVLNYICVGRWQRDRFEIIASYVMAVDQWFCLMMAD